MTLDLDNAVSLDLETTLIRPGLCSPPVVVCGLWGPRYGAELHGTWELEAPVRALLDSDRLVIGHNVSYDFLCLFEHYPALRERIVAAYEADRILDTGLAQRIIEISTGDLRGRLALDRLCAAYGLVCEKTEERTDFGRFWGQPASALPERHRRYALGDCEQTHRLFQRIWGRELVSRRDLAKFCRTDLWLKACSGYGLRTDPDRVAALETKAANCISGLTEMALELGYMRREGRRPEPVRTMANIRIAVCDAYGLEYRREGNRIIPLSPEDAPPGLITDAGQVSTSKLVLRESGSPQLEQLGDLGEWLAVWNKDLALFRQGTQLPFHTRFGFANTTRTTSSSPNIQNFRKKAGIRECIVPRGGAFVDTDFTGVELSALAQICINLHGDRRMADRINAGVDMHAEVGAELLRLPYDEVVRRRKAYKSGDHSDEARQANFSRDCGKYGNFGCMGYMTNPATFASYVRLGSISAETGLPMINLSVPEAQRVIDAWYSSQHAQVRYLRGYVDGLRQGSHRGALYSVPIPGTDIVRRGATRTAAANTPFQGLAMQVAAEAGWTLFVEQLLHGRPGRVCVFAHDAFLSDCRPDQADEVAALHESAMLGAAAKLMPDIRQKTDSVAMSCWAKDAERVVVDGKLQVYEVR